MENQPTVSFIVPVRDDAIRLRRCLASILRNQYPPHQREIIVIDNGSRDRSVRVARRAGARVLTGAGLCVAELRNLGASAARGEILAFIDADHEIDPGWTAWAAEDLGREAVGAVGAPYLAPPVGTWVQSSFDAMRHRQPGCCEVEWLASGNMAVWRGDFERLRGFDTSLESCEDFDLCQRLRATGRRVLSDDRLKSVHFGDPDTLRALFLAELWRGRDNLRAGLRGPITLRGLPSLVIPVLELGGLALAVGGLLTAPDGLALTLTGPAVLGTFAALRASRMLSHRRVAGPVEAAQDFTVACVYDLARALALVFRASHHQNGRNGRKERSGRNRH